MLSTRLDQTLPYKPINRIQAADVAKSVAAAAQAVANSRRQPVDRQISTGSSAFGGADDANPGGAAAPAFNGQGDASEAVAAALPDLSVGEGCVTEEELTAVLRVVVGMGEDSKVCMGWVGG